MSKVKQMSRPAKLWLAGVAIATGACAGALAAPPVIHGGNGITLGPPPVTATETVTDTMSGHTVEDPYRWLEDQKAPRTRAWMPRTAIPLRTSTI